MQISATVIADSIHAEKHTRITTLELHYHRYILPEFNTHRAFSRNGASSRAIPTKKLIEKCVEEMVEPLEWGLNQSGMQAFTHADEELTTQGRAIWNAARADAIRHAHNLNELGFAKQIVNRVLEPYLSTRTVVTSTDWANWETLRYHKDAQPEIRELARRIIMAVEASDPEPLVYDQWHLPYIMEEDDERVDMWVNQTDIVERIKPYINLPETWFKDDRLLLKAVVSAARCARVSYRTHEGKKTDFEKDLELFQRLVATQPVHASPTEHQATPCGPSQKLTGNFRNWAQFRKLIVNETIEDRY